MDSTSAGRAFGAPTRRVLAAVSLSLLVTAQAAAQPDDRSLRSYFTANGLLNRGLHAEAAAEYEAFLESDPRGPEAATARYGLAVALSHLGRADDALACLEDLDPPSGFPFQFESDLLRGQLLYGRAAFGDAADVFSRLARRSSDHPQAHEAAGLWVECLHRAGDHAESARRAGEVLGERAFRGRDVDRAALFGGLSLSLLGDDADAAELLRPVSEREDELGHSAALSLAGVLLRLGENAEAGELYDRLARLDDERWSAQALLGSARIRRAAGAHDGAISLLERLGERYPDSAVSVEAQLELGINLIETREFDAGREALPSFDEDDDSPLASQSAYWRAKSQLREGDAEAAAAGLEAALDDFPDSPLVPEMRYDLGVALADSGEPGRAVTAFESVWRADPDHRLAQPAILAQATTLLRMGQFERAREYAARVDSEAPESPEADLIVAEADALLGEHDAAVDRLSGWLDSHPRHQSADRAKYRLSMSLAALGRLGEAESAAGTLLTGGTVSEDFGPGLIVLGDAAFRDEDWQRAEHWYQRAVEQGVPPLDAARLKLGLALARQDRHEDALPLFEQAAAGEADEDTTTQALFELGQARLMLGQDDQAAEAFETLLESAPRSRFAAYAMRQLGSIAERTGDAGTAAEWYAKAAGAGGDTAAGSRRDQARAALAAGLYEIPARLAANHDDPDLHAYAGIAIARDGDPEAAVEILDAVLGAGGMSDDVRSSALLEKAWCERRLGDDEGAMRSLRSLLDDEQSDRYAVYAALEASSIELDAGRTDQAAAWLDRAGDTLREHPAVEEPAMRAQLDYRLAQHAGVVGEPERVIELLEPFDERHAGHELGAPAAVLLGDALIETHQPVEAAAAFERAAGEATGELRATSMLRLGDALAQSERWADSREVFEEFLAENPGSAFAFEAEFGRAWALEHEGEHERAREGYAAVIESHRGPTAARAQFQIGECLFAEGRLEEAVRELLRVDILYDYPEWSAAALYDAGRAFEQLRKFGEARQQYREVVGRFGDSTWAALAEDRLRALASGDG